MTTNPTPYAGKRHVREEEGSAAMEFAAAAAVFFMTMIGLMKICLAVYTYHYVAEVAREGTRWAIVRGTSCRGFSSRCPANADGSDTTAYVKSLSYPGISPSLLTVTSAYSQYPVGRACTPSTSCNNPGDLITVQVQYAFPLDIPFMPKRTLNMTSSSSMVIQQ